jgi:hypothetical protein
MHDLGTCRSARRVDVDVKASRDEEGRWLAACERRRK